MPDNHSIMRVEISPAVLLSGILVTPEYNHSTSGVLKHAIDYLYAAWSNKAAGFVSYGAAGAGELNRASIEAEGRADRLGSEGAPS